MAEQVDEQSFFKSLLTELVSSPVNVGLLGVCMFLIYKIIKGRNVEEADTPKEPQLKPLKRQDMTLEQLKVYDGKGGDGRILIAVNRKIFDVTRGKAFYGPGICICFLGPNVQRGGGQAPSYMGMSMYYCIINLIPTHQMDDPLL